jgi:small conductance mechanosensitive channel
MLTKRDNKSVFIQNKGVFDGNLINYSKMELFRLELFYGISYGVDIRKAKSIVEEFVSNADGATDQPLRQ